VLLTSLISVKSHFFFITSYSTKLEDDIYSSQCVFFYQVFLPRNSLLHIFMRSHYTPRENPCNSFPVTRMMPIWSPRSALSPAPPCHTEAHSNDAYFTLSKLTVGSFTQHDAVGAMHLVTNTPPGPSSYHTSVFWLLEAVWQHSFLLPSSPLAVTQRLQWHVQF
jgi:hypothetical protein